MTAVSFHFWCAAAPVPFRQSQVARGTGVPPVGSWLFTRRRDARATLPDGAFAPRKRGAWPSFRGLGSKILRYRACPLHQLGEQGPKWHDHWRGMSEEVDRLVREVEHGLECEGAPVCNPVNPVLLSKNPFSGSSHLQPPLSHQPIEASTSRCGAFQASGTKATSNPFRATRARSCLENPIPSANIR